MTCRECKVWRPERNPRVRRNGYHTGKEFERILQPLLRETSGRQSSRGLAPTDPRSAGGQDAFLFNANLFSPMTFKELMKMDWNKCIYRNEGIGKDNTYSKSGLSIFGSLFDPFKKQFIQMRDTTKEWQNLTNKGEQLYKLIFDTLAKLYKFN